MEREMKESGIPWIGLIPEEWNIVRTKNVFASSKSLVGENWNKTQLLSLTTKGIKKAAIGSTSGKVPDSYETYQVVNKDDLVMCLFDLDCSAVFSGVSYFQGMISPAYKVLKILEGYSSLFYGYWFDYIFEGRKYKYFSKNIRYSLTYDEFAALGIAAPPLSTQQRIANFLDRKCAEIDELAALQETMIAELKKYKQSVITEAVTKGLNKNVPMKDSGVEWIGKIPFHWNETKVLNLLSMPITDGPHESPDFMDSGVPFISAEAVSGGFINFDNKRGYISQKYHEECCKKYIPQMYDIYMIKSGATTGKTAIVETNEIFTIWSPLAVFRSNTSIILPYILLYVLRSYGFQKQVETNWSYGTQQNIGMRTLEKLIVSFPTVPEQQKIANYLDRKCAEIDELITIKQQKLEALKEFKKSIIFEYVTGKKEVME